MPETRIHQLFLVSIALKGAHALIETAGGLALYLFSTEAIVDWLYRFGQSEWAARTFPSEHHYYAFYLLSHGIVNLALVIGLFRRQLWAYPATFAVLTGFIVYQLYRYTFTHDIGLLFLSALDLIVMALAWNEYRLVRRDLRPR